VPQQGEVTHDWAAMDTIPEHQAAIFSSDYFSAIGQMPRNAQISFQILPMFTLTTRLQQSAGFRAVDL
jgi:hypothetical protein